MSVETGAAVGCMEDAVCIQAEKIYDICKDKECLEDLRVYFCEKDQDRVDRATSIKFRRAEIIWVTTDVEQVPFNRGYYSVDICFYFRINLELCHVGRPCYVDGLATYTKKVILYGSEGSAYMFTSEYRGGPDVIEPKSTNLPKAVVEVVDPIALDAKLIDACCEQECRRCDADCEDDKNRIPDCICNLFGGELGQFDDRKRVYVTIGIFVIVRLQRSTQLMVPSYDYCIPDKECVSTSANDDDPCSLFEKIQFPYDEFYPPKDCEDNRCGSKGI